jgi:hypothetical protein
MPGWDIREEATGLKLKISKAGNNKPRVGPNSKFKNCTSVAPTDTKMGTKLGGCSFAPPFFEFWAREIDPGRDIIRLGVNKIFKRRESPENYRH